VWDPVEPGARTRTVGPVEEGGAAVVERAATRDVREVLVAEERDRRDDRGRGGVAEGAERLAGDVVGDVEQSVQIVGGGGAVLESVHDLLEPVRALAAGGALAARLVGVELRPPQHRPHDAGGVIEDLQCLGAEHGALGGAPLVVEWHVELGVGEQRGRGAARGPELQGVALADPAGQVE